MEDDPRRCVPIPPAPEPLLSIRWLWSAGVRHCPAPAGVCAHRCLQGDKARSPANSCHTHLCYLWRDWRYCRGPHLQAAQREELGVECGPYRVRLPRPFGNCLYLGQHHRLEQRVYCCSALHYDRGMSQ
jgi:hypothetical protein